MSNLGKGASAIRTFHFTSKGGGFTAMWMGDKGDLYQEFSGSGATAVYYPNISATNPQTMQLTVMSAKTSGTVTPAAVTYYANEVELKFNTSRACINPGWENIFRLTADNMLQIIGNLAKVANHTSYMLKADISVSAATGTDKLFAYAPVTVAPYSGKDSSRVTIAAPDGKNFTITEHGGSCKLKALTFKGGQEVAPSGLAYEWYKLVAGAYTKLPVTTQEITVNEGDVDTYANYKAIVKQAGETIGFDIQGVLDASDPYDIVTSIKVFNGTGNAVSTNDETLSDEMPSTAYLEYTCQLVQRGSTTPVTGTQTFTFTVVAANGAQLYHPTTLSGGKACRITIADLLNWNAGIGDYQLVIDATLS
ncbi:hypothetical protein [uncultured Alistipes sp.]|uniref:hypothetical protein n=1 Tax=uncultured Alistipes sp. TaxID=538949 RepID=UPI0026362BD2|nr:hypothetical protein [uncultured Alistipes sp.]